MDAAATSGIDCAASTVFDVESIRSQFPALKRRIGKHPLVYFDNAATSQKPQSVIDRLVTYYSSENSNVHRGAHTLAREATAGYENARETIRKHLNASFPDEIVFTRGTTESINLVAGTYGRTTLQPSDEVLVSAMEHHSNLVPWQRVCEERGAKLVVVPLTEQGELDELAFGRLLSKRTRIVAMCHVSNSLGTINPAKRIVEKAKAMGATVLLDGAQAAAHLLIDVQDLSCDFYCISAHKMCGPTGIGALYVRREIAEEMIPYQGGGEMIHSVTFQKTTYAEPPYRFEAGTPNIAGAIGFAEAIRFLQRTGFETIKAYEDELVNHATDVLSRIERLRLIGTAGDKVPVFSFLIDGIHPLDLGSMLDTKGFAVRTGHHCTEPLMHYLGITGTVRASLSFYNTVAEVDRFAAALRALIPILQ